MDSLSFLKLASNLVPRFSDNAEELEYFIDQVNQLREATPTNLQSNLLSFVKGRLLGKARTITRTATSIDNIIDLLRDEITLESSEIIESKIVAVRFDNKNLSDFATSVEALADRFINSLTHEGVKL